MGIMENRMETTTMSYMGGCQNYGPLLGTLNIRGRIIIWIQKGTIILTTIHAAVKCEPVQLFLDRSESWSQQLGKLELLVLPD